MEIPASIAPFVEDDSGPGWWPRLAGRLVKHPPLLAFLAAAIGLLLWIDAAQDGIVANPLGSPRLLTTYLLAAAIGVVVAGRIRPRTNAHAIAVAGTARLPVFLQFDRRPVVVVGGGAVAASKIPALVAAGAHVTVVAPAICAAIDRARVRVVERAFLPSDLDGAWFVTAAATAAVNRQVREAAESRAIFVNAVDDPANATAYLGGTIRRGGVTVAFSTGGRAPALAGLLREAFDELLPADLETWLERASELREHQRRAVVPMGARRPALLDALNRLYDTSDRQTS